MTTPLTEVLRSRGITGARVDPELGYANQPTLHVDVSRLPDPDDFHYHPYDLPGGGTLWWARDESGG